MLSLLVSHKKHSNHYNWWCYVNDKEIGKRNTNIRLMCIHYMPECVHTHTLTYTKQSRNIMSITIMSTTDLMTLADTHNYLPVPEGQSALPWRQGAWQQADTATGTRSSELRAPQTWSRECKPEMACDFWNLKACRFDALLQQGHTS